jgi:Xaa-Pro aminopeptidase
VQRLTHAFPRTVFLLGLLLPLAAVAQVAPEEYAERRGALAREVQNGLILAVGSAEPPQDYIAFYQNSPFRYLTGFTEPNAALVMRVRNGSVEGETLFVNPRAPADETWEGYRVGPEGAQGATGIAGRSVEELPEVMDSLLGGGWSSVSVVGPYAPTAAIRNDVTQRVQELLDGRSGVQVRSVNSAVDRLRGVKSDAEIELLRRATAITIQAHDEILGALEPGMNEFEVHALLEYTFRRYGAERPAFSSIVGSGRNSTVLHYNANDRYMESGDVVVVDIGASYGGYAADITRTYPVSGRFTDAQRDIYQLVRDAQAAAEAVARPGVTQSQMSQTAAGVLARGLTELGLIEGPNATYDEANGQQYPQYFLYYMHALGHGIGLDVHDPWPSTLEAGVPFTIEPGIYVRPNLFTEVLPDTPRNRALRDAVGGAFQRYVNIGVRIEDDYLITENGVEWISPGPREIEEIEEAMARAWTAPEGRNADWVEWYRESR